MASRMLTPLFRVDEALGQSLPSLIIPLPASRPMTVLVDRLSELDTTWQEGEPALPAELVQSNRGSLSPIELAELLAADSEWRWRRAGINAHPVRDMETPWSDFRPRPAEVYWDTFPELASTDDSRMRFVEAEFMARSRWGDPPMIAEFVARFADIEGIQSHLQDCLDEITQLVVVRQDKTSTDIRQQPWYVVRSPLSIGRQSASEPRDQFILEEGRRLIVANNYEHGVSRKHAIVWRQAVDRCLVENVSPLGEMQVNESCFPPGWSQVILLPLTIEIAGVQLKFFQR